jgi:hypothetical protein
MRYVCIVPPRLCVPFWGGQASKEAARGAPGGHEGRQAGDRRHPIHLLVRQRAQGSRLEVTGRRSLGACFSYIAGPPVGDPARRHNKHNKAVEKANRQQARADDFILRARSVPPARPWSGLASGYPAAAGRPCIRSSLPTHDGVDPDRGEW